MSLEWAKHNEELCIQLHSEGKWNDWVVTTAFYSTVQYVDHALFPLKIKDAEYKNFEEYYSQLPYGRRSKHEVRLDLVFTHLRKAHDAFKWLYNTCKTARYNNYDLSSELADRAVLKLKVVKSCCVSATPPPQPGVVVPAESAQR
jgi:hypothetical protein